MDEDAATRLAYRQQNKRVAELEAEGYTSKQARFMAQLEFPTPAQKREQRKQTNDRKG